MLLARNAPPHQIGCQPPITRPQIARHGITGFVGVLPIRLAGATMLMIFGLSCAGPLASSSRAEDKSEQSAATSSQADWHQFRGDRSDGTYRGATDLPTRWAEDEQVVWKSPVPGLGGSSPVLDSQAIYLTSGVDGSNTLMAFDRQSGNKKWAVQLGDETSNKHHPKGGGSNPTPVVIERDGRSIIVAYFRSGQVAGVTDEGKVLWQWNVQKRYGEDTLWWDLGSSPIRVGDDVLLTVVQSGPSYLLRVEPETGDVLWKALRDVPSIRESEQTYATPVLVSVDGKEYIAVLGADHLTLHDPDDGSMAAKLGGFNPTNNEYYRSIASPVATGNVLIFPYARGETVTAIDLEGLVQGTERPVLWECDTTGTDVPTPAIANGCVYVVSDSKRTKGKISALDLFSGNEKWSVQLPKFRFTVSGSPLVAGNHLYVTREDGTTFVIGPLDASDPGIVSENKLADRKPYTVTGAIPIGSDLLLRTRRSLYRIGGQR